MFGSGVANMHGKHSPPRVVVPFYGYAALSLLASTLLLALSSSSFTGHYFHPRLLAVTHLMALGWGTMMILGASHQLVPVLLEEPLYSRRLALLSFGLAGAGIPLLAYGFYVFDMGLVAKWGGRLVLLAVITYLINLGQTIRRAKRRSAEAVFLFTAACWLLVTSFWGLALVYNFSFRFLPLDFLRYLPLHAHAGIIGWFLLLIIGVASRLVPMFLISSFRNEKALWIIYACVNGGLIFYGTGFFLLAGTWTIIVATGLVAAGLLAFMGYCYRAWRQRLRRQVDGPMQTALVSVPLMLVPVILLLLLTGWMLQESLQQKLALVYGFIIFFGWITALILGMTFKTLPFIVWIKVYQAVAGRVKTPAPRDLYSHRLFVVMAFVYAMGFFVFLTGVGLSDSWLIGFGSWALLAAALLYVVKPEI